MFKVLIDYLPEAQEIKVVDNTTRVIDSAVENVLTGQDAKRHIRNSLASAQNFKAKIDRYLDRFDGDQEAVVTALFKEEYDDTGAVLQDRRSFLLNLTAKVRTAAEGK